MRLLTAEMWVRIPRRPPMGLGTAGGGHLSCKQESQMGSIPIRSIKSQGSSCDPVTGCSRVERRLIWDQEFAGSIPVIPMIAADMQKELSNRSVKPLPSGVVGSSPTLPIIMDIFSCKRAVTALFNCNLLL